jgi:hypothetical protein
MAAIYYIVHHSAYPAVTKQFIVPFSQDEHFVGREEILDQLDSGLEDARKTPGKHRRDALVGLGGVG